MRVRSLSQQHVLKEEMASHSSILAGKVHGQRSLVGYTVHAVTKELDMTEQLSTRACTHSKIDPISA